MHAGLERVDVNVNLRLYSECTAALVLQVQGVNFRSGTIDHANKVGVVGHVENTSSGTVTGEVQGEKQPVSQMKVSRLSWKAHFSCFAYSQASASVGLAAKHWSTWSQN